jgi:predicted nucleotidyltransferase
MRLDARAVRDIEEIFLQVFEKGELFLFGSRVDDTRKGGDIDLYLVPESKDALGLKRIEFLTRVKRRLGERHIDLVIDRGTERPIDTRAREEGLLLCKRH